MLDRQECRLDTKYGKVFTKTKNVPIIMIANKLPSSTRYHGPLRARFIRVPFSSRITEIEEERLIATLWGCVQRRAIQAYAGFYPTPVDIKMDYNECKGIIVTEEGAIRRKQLQTYDDLHLIKADSIKDT